MLEHFYSAWVVKKTDHNGQPIPEHRQKPRKQTVYTREAHEFRLAKHFGLTAPIARAAKIPERPLRGWLGGLGAVDWGLIRAPKPNLLGNPVAVAYYGWIQRLRPFKREEILPVSPFDKRKPQCWCTYKAVRAPKMFHWDLPVKNLVPCGRHIQAQPIRRTRKEIIDLYRSFAPHMTATWRIREEASWHRYSDAILKKIDHPYEPPFELAFPYCERNLASRWPRVWIGPSVMPRHTVYNSAVGLDFTERTLADARRAYLISHPELADLWGCSERTVWTRLQGMRCSCRVCLTAKRPEFWQFLYRVILPTIRPYWGLSEIGSQRDKGKQRKADRARKFDRPDYAPSWGWERATEE